MDEQKSERNVSASSNAAVTTRTTASNTNHVRRRNIRNFILIWLDVTIDQSSKDAQNTLAQLQSVAIDINMFTQVDECVDFLTDVEDMMVFLIIEGNLGQQITPLIHDIPQLAVVYIFDNNKFCHEEWIKQWNKIKEVHSELTPIREALQIAVKQCDQNSIALSFVTMNEEAFSQNLDQVDPSFMYTQIFKETLLEIEYNEQAIKDFAIYCRKGDYGSLNNISRFENEYHANSAISRYTSPSFIYSMLNCALRMLESETIINMGFFIRDLHHQIEGLHRQQLDGYRRQSFIVYRGQGLSITDFEKLQRIKVGLISFNNFLSTSTNRQVSLEFAMSAFTQTDMVGILFQISIDPTVSSVPFAAIQEVSYFQAEEEILFSMHTIFRIGEITKIANNNPLYQVELKLTSDDDEELHTLTEYIRQELEGDTGWKRIGKLLLTIGPSDKAEEFYKLQLQQTFNDSEKALCYNNLGQVKDDQGDYEKAISFHEKALEIWQKTMPTNYHSLATSYNNIGSAYRNIGDYSKALSSFGKALEIEQKTLPKNHPSLANSSNNIGTVYENMGEYSKALSFHEKALEIWQKTLPKYHPSLATSCNNIATVYENMGEYSKALSFHDKALEIKQKTLPKNHPSLSNSCNNIGAVYENMEEYSKALSSFEKALEIHQKTLPKNHVSLATSCHNIALIYHDMGEYSKALSSYEKALEIWQKTLPKNHPSLATSCNNIGTVYRSMGEYSKALSFHEKALEIWQKTLPKNHPSLATSYNNIGAVYENMGEYSKALSSFEKTREIFEETLPVNHPLLATSYNNIGVVCANMENYSKALWCHEKALEIRQNALPANHPSLVTSYNNIALVYDKMGDFSKVLLNLECARDIKQRSLPPNHPSIQNM